MKYSTVMGSTTSDSFLRSKHPIELARELSPKYMLQVVVISAYALFNSGFGFVTSQPPFATYVSTNPLGSDLAFSSSLCAEYVTPEAVALLYS